MFREPIRTPVKINDTTYERELPNGKVEIGDKDSVDFKPNLKLKRWGEECFIKVGLPTSKKKSPIVEGEKIKWQDTDREARFYPLEPTVVTAKDKDNKDVEFTQNELGGFEFEIILKKKPSSNKIVLDIEAQGLKFYYQPPLAPKELAQGRVRPENVIGSYAVYHSTRTNFHTNAQDAEKYKCGKAFHIYRPKVTDALGKECWAELHINEKLTITIPQDWLDKAVYPVLVDPNFGYETKGGTSYAYWDFDGSKFTAPAGGTVTSISMYLMTSNGGNVNFGYYNDNAGAPGTHVAHGTAENLGSFIDWKTIAVSGSITNGNFYWLVGQQDATIFMYYDGGDANQEAEDASYAFDTWGDNPSGLSYYAAVLSIFATYTAGGGGETLYGQAILVGVGSTTILAKKISRGEVLFEGVGNLTAIGNAIAAQVTLYGQALLAGVGNLTVLGKRTLKGTTTLAGVGNLTASAKKILRGTTILAGVGNLTTVGKKVLRGVSVLAGVGTLTAVGKTTKGGKVVLAGVGTLTATGYSKVIRKVISLSVKLHSRALSVALHGRSLITNLHNRSLSVKTRSKP